MDLVIVQRDVILINRVPLLYAYLLRPRPRLRGDEFLQIADGVVLAAPRASSGRQSRRALERSRARTHLHLTRIFFPSRSFSVISIIVARASAVRASRVARALFQRRARRARVTRARGAMPRAGGATPARADAFQAHERLVACAARGGLRWDEMTFVAFGSRRARVAKSDDDARAIDAAWARRPRCAHDGAKFRLADVATASGDDGGVVVRVECGLTDYRTFWGTNLAERWDAYAVERGADDAATRTTSPCGRASAATGTAARFAHYAMALGNCVCLRASDGKFLALHRSRDVGEAPGALVFPGGHAEPSDVAFDADVDAMDASRYMFECALAELREELGVGEEHVERLRCLGVTLRVVNARPCVVFYARTALSSEEILRDHYPRAEHAFESASAAALALDEFDRARMPGDHVGALDLVAVALAADDAAVALAADDPPWRRGSYS